MAFKPVDNTRLAALCGPLDANLRQIETALDVSISRRGERFSIAGGKDRAAQAAQALRRFYDRAGREELSVEDIQLGLVEIGHSARGAEVESTWRIAAPMRGWTSAIRSCIAWATAR